MSKARKQSDALFAEYAATGSLNVRNRIVERYQPLVRSIAAFIGQRLPDEVDPNDLIQAGNCGLIGAVQAFKPERGYQFSTFAQFRIRGAIIDWLRDIDCVSRNVRERAKRLAEAISQFEVELGRPPGQDELRRRLKVDGHQLQKMVTEKPPAFVSLYTPIAVGEHAEFTGVDHAIDHREASAADRIEARDAVEHIIRLVLADSISDALLLRMHYLEHMTLRAIAKHFGGLSDCAMSVRRRTLLDRLRARFDLRDLRQAMREAA